MFEKVATINDLLSLTADYYGEKPAFSYKKDGKICTVSYADFSRQVKAAARSLVSKDITNSKVAIISENSYHCLMWSFAVPLSGNVLVMLDNMAAPEENAYIVEHSDTVCLIYSAYNQPFCDYLMENNNIIRHTICIEGDTEDCLHGQGAAALPQTDGSELSHIFYTSGTTGKPKGVMQSQLNLLRTNYYFSSALEVKDSIYLVLPLHHILPFANVVLLSMYRGLTLYISAGLKHFLPEMQEMRPYCVFMVPALLAYFANTVEAAAQKLMAESGLDNLSARRQALKELFGEELKMICIGGAPLHADIAQRVQELGVMVINGYGLTETCGAIAFNPPADNRLGSIGKVIAHAEVKLVEEELAFKSPYLFLGYYKDPETSRQVFDGGWFLTGDLGYIEDDYIYFAGRKKNLIVLPNGKNLCPEEIEIELLKIEEIIEVVVSEQNGKLTAEIYSPHDQQQIRKKINELNRKLSSYKQIENIKFRSEEFPKTTSKKIKRG